jgi:serine/threonine protein kinase
LKKSTRLDESIIRLIALDLLVTVDYVHLKGICHRDIKPDNILINESALIQNSSPCIKLIDFGVSKRFNQILPGKVGSVTLDMWTTTGNVHYCAPEILKKGRYDASVDVWAVGVVLY